MSRWPFINRSINWISSGPSGSCSASTRSKSTKTNLAECPVTFSSIVTSFHVTEALHLRKSRCIGRFLRGCDKLPSSFLACGPRHFPGVELSLTADIDTNTWHNNEGTAIQPSSHLSTTKISLRVADLCDSHWFLRYKQGG